MGFASAEGRNRGEQMERRKNKGENINVELDREEKKE
jgi:hypothetical protein